LIPGLVKINGVRLDFADNTIVGVNLRPSDLTERESPGNKEGSALEPEDTIEALSTGHRLATEHGNSLWC